MAADFGELKVETIAVGRNQFVPLRFDGIQIGFGIGRPTEGMLGVGGEEQRLQERRVECARASIVEE